MLSFEQKLAIIESFAELERKDVSLGRVNFQYPGSVHDKKNVVYHLHPNGNGFVYAGLLPDCPADDKGFVNIRDLPEHELRSLIADSIRSLSTAAEPAQASGQRRSERWTGTGNQSLTLKFEDDFWYIFAGLNLDSVFETYEEAVEYLQEEGFTRS